MPHQELTQPLPCGLKTLPIQSTGCQLLLQGRQRPQGLLLRGLVPVMEPLPGPSTSGTASQHSK